MAEICYRISGKIMERRSREKGKKGSRKREARGGNGEAKRRRLVAMQRLSLFVVTETSGYAGGGIPLAFASSVERGSSLTKSPNIRKTNGKRIMPVYER